MLHFLSWLVFKISSGDQVHQFPKKAGGGSKNRIIAQR